MKHVKFFHSARSSVLPFAIALIAGFLLSGFAQAAPLTGDQIQSFIDSMSETEKLGDEYPELDREDDDQAQDMARPMSSSLEKLDDHPEVRAKLEDIVQEYGFDSIPEWADVGDRVLASMMAINLQAMPAEQRAMMEAMASPDTDPNMSEAQKAQMQQMGETMRGLMEAADSVSEEDIEAVRPFLDELQAMGEE